MIEALTAKDAEGPNVGLLYTAALKDTIERFEATGSPMITGGEQRKLLPFVFDRFHQGDASTSGRFGGLRLGLAMVKTLVELHGGTDFQWGRRQGGDVRGTPSTDGHSQQK